MTGGHLILETGAVIRDNYNINTYEEDYYTPGVMYINGGVYVSGGRFTMNGGTISENTSDDNGIGGGGGGGVLVESGGTFTMNGGTISGNVSATGGGVYVQTGMFTMNGGEIRGNTAPVGGGVALQQGKLEYDFTRFAMNGGTIRGNTAVTYGGGVALYESYCGFSKTGGTIYGDTDATHTAGGNENIVTAGAGGKYGHAVYVDLDDGNETNGKEGGKKRDSTAGQGVQLYWPLPFNAPDNWDAAPVPVSQRPPAKPVA
jgi:hypothetical protein